MKVQAEFSLKETVTLGINLESEVYYSIKSAYISESSPKPELQYFCKKLDSTKSYRIDAVVLNTTGAGQRRYFQKKAWNVISTNPALPPSVMSGKKSICSPT